MRRFSARVQRVGLTRGFGERVQRVGLVQCAWRRVLRALRCAWRESRVLWHANIARIRVASLHALCTASLRALRVASRTYSREPAPQPRAQINL